MTYRRLIALLLMAGPVLADPAAAADSDYADEGGRPMFGIGMGLVPIEVQGRENLEVGQGISAQYIIPGTAAAAMGVQAGDVVLAVNGIPIGSPSEMIEAVMSHQAGDPVEALISRGGQQLELGGGGTTFRPWPANLPLPHADREGDRRAQEWQRRQMEAMNRQIAKLRNQIAEVQERLAAPPRDSRAVAEAKRLLEALPAWRLILAIAAPDIAPQGPPVAAAVPPAAQPGPDASPAWILSYHLQ
jgi:hypothetical protein